MILAIFWQKYNQLGKEILLFSACQRKRKSNVSFFLVRDCLTWLEDSSPIEYNVKYTNPANRQSNFCMQKLWAPPMVPTDL